MFCPYIKSLNLSFHAVGHNMNLPHLSTGAILAIIKPALSVWSQDNRADNLRNYRHPEQKSSERRTPRANMSRLAV